MEKIKFHYRLVALREKTKLNISSRIKLNKLSKDNLMASLIMEYTLRMRKWKKSIEKNIKENLNIHELCENLLDKEVDLILERSVKRVRTK